PAVSGGGMLIHTGVHSFDLVRFLTGHEIARVWCRTARAVTHRTEDNFMAMLELGGSDALVAVNGSRATAGRSSLIDAAGAAGQLGAALGGARWGRCLLLMVPYSAVYFFIDAFVVQRAVSWFNVPVAYRDILPVRATTYILSLVNTQLGQGGIALYLNRRHHIPFWEVTGTVLFLSFVEVYQLAFYSLIGAVAAGELGRVAPVSVYVALAAYL